MPVVQANDMKLYQEREGSGPPLLILAGTGLPTTAWKTGPSAQCAAEGFTVITYHHCGAGSPMKVRKQMLIYVRPRQRFAIGTLISFWR